MRVLRGGDEGHRHREIVNISFLHVDGIDVTGFKVFWMAEGFVLLDTNKK